jgi:hypothetical protein
MSVRTEVRGWTVDRRERTLVFEFGEDMDQSEFGESAWRKYTDLLDDGEVDAVVTVLELDEAFSSDTFDVWAESAAAAVDAGVDRWAIVADDKLKRMSIRSQMDESGLSVESFADRDEALAWATP